MVICNKCDNGYPISNQFEGSCPDGWTTHKDPCKNKDKISIAPIEGFQLFKEVYGKTNAKNNLDEEFTEFAFQTKNYKEFFDLYNSFFYDIPKDTHKSLYYESKNYLGYPFSTVNNQIVEGLEDQLNDIQDQIDRIERFHPIFKNGSILSDSTKRQELNGKKYLLQSNRKRLIKNPEIYIMLKARLKINEPDDDFIIFIPESGLADITDGPPITEPNEIFIENKLINTYYG